MAVVSRHTLPHLPALLLAWALAATLAACGGSEPDESEPLTTLDVEPGLEIAFDDDPEAAPRRPELVGVLPDDFPPDLPLFLPASLIDFGTSEHGRRSVSLLTAQSLGRTRNELSKLLAARGWATAPGDGGLTLEKGGRRAWIFFEDAQPGTIYRFEY